MRGANKILLLLLWAILLNSCKMNELMDLNIDHSEPVEIEIDLGSDLNELIAEDLMPMSISYHFFAKSRYAISTSQTIEFGSDEKVTVTPGTYDVICYTSDFYDIDALIYPYSISSVDEFAISVVTKGTLVSDTKNETYTQEIWAPDPMFYTIMEDVDISTTEAVDISLTPGTFKYRIIFPTVDAHLISGGSISLSGVKTALNLYNGDYPTDIDGIQDDPDFMMITADDDNFYADFYSLGFNEYGDTNIELTLTSNELSGYAVVTITEVGDIFDTNAVEQLFEDLRNSPTGGVITYQGILDATLLLNIKDVSPTIEPWDDNSVDMLI